MRWFCRRRAELGKADLDDLSRRLTKTVELTEQRLVATLRPRPSRSRLAAFIAGVIAVVSGVACYGVYASAQSGTPTLSAPGRIGVAVIGDTGSSTPLEVSAGFSVDSSKVLLTVTDLSGQTYAGDTPRVVVYLCGAVRDAARVSDPNLGRDLDLKQLPPLPIEMDSRLGDRRECSYTIAKFNFGFQALVEISTTHSNLSASGANVVYRLPGITTLIVNEKLDGSTVHPLKRESTINVALRRTPVDLTITSSRPQIPSSGETAWSYTVADPDLPEDYRISGFLSAAQQAAQTRTFIAGALVGVSGAAVLWFFEALVQNTGERSRRKPD